MTAVVLYCLLAPYEPDEIVWNKAGTWGAYAFPENLHPKFEGRSPGAISLYITNKDRSVRKRLYTGYWPGMDENTPESEEFVFPTAVQWAPDQRHVLFYKRHYMSVNMDSYGAPLFDVDTMTGEVRKLSMAFRREDGYMDDHMLFGHTVCFSPDGKSLLLVMGGGKFGVENKRIALLDYRTLKRKWLTDFDHASTCPSWSPGGTRIAYASNPSELPEPERKKYAGSMAEVMQLYNLKRIWIMNADGTDKHAITHDANQSDGYPKWVGPNEIQFIRGGDTEPNDQVWEMHSDGAGLHYVRDLDARESNLWRYGNDLDD